MKPKCLNIKRVTPLVNGFSELVLDAPGFNAALPGHFVILAEKYPYYLLNQQDETISLIVKKQRDLDFNNINTITVSSLHGSSLAAPIKNEFNLILAEESALNACVFYFKKYKHQFEGLALLGAEHFPFKPCPSRFIIPGIPNEVIAAIPLFEDWRIPHRLASIHSQPGCFHGSVKDLASLWLNHTKIAKPLNTIYIAAPHKS